MCEPIEHIKWLNSTSNPLDIFSGGVPSEDKDDHNIVTVIQGTEHVALDFSSKVIDFVTINGTVIDFSVYFSISLYISLLCVYITVLLICAHS